MRKAERFAAIDQTVQVKSVGLTGLSMGMSSDYPTAVTIGATHIRVGSAIFGARHYPA